MSEEILITTMNDVPGYEVTQVLGDAPLQERLFGLSGRQPR